MWSSCTGIRVVSVRCAFELDVWMPFHLHPQYDPGYVNTVNVGHKGGFGQE